MQTLYRKSVDAVNDIQLINRYSIKELKPEDVFVFSVVLCDNEVDRDNEKFADSALDELAPLFEGKTGIFNHSWDAGDQIARIYKTGVETAAEKNSLGESLKQLVAFAYILRNEFTAETISKIEGGILKEVSVGLSVKYSICSICGKTMGWRECEDGHRKGLAYEEGLCFGVLKTPTDAYEFSFVAVPAQRGAGVTKSFEDIDNAMDVLLFADLSQCPDKTKLLLTQCQTALLSEQERVKRNDILTDNKNYLNRKDN